MFDDDFDTFDGDVEERFEGMDYDLFEESCLDLDRAMESACDAVEDGYLDTFMEDQIGGGSCEDF